MKKILLIFISIICLSSCVNEQISYEDDFGNEKTATKFERVRHLYYNGHTYLYFHFSGYRAGIAHDPDCPACNSKNNSN